MRRKSVLLFSALLGASTAASADDYVTGSRGNGQAFSNYQPSLVLTQSLATNGIYPPRDGSSTEQYLGMVHSFAGNYNAFGMSSANGALRPISQNTALFSIMGTYYGGDGKSTYALPDLVGRTAIGTGQGPGLPNFVIGQEAGAANVTLSSLNMPAHAHQFTPGEFTSITGGNMPFDNYQPSLAMTYMIATQGIYPSPGSGSGHTMIGEIGLFAGGFEPGAWMQADGRLLSIAENDVLFTLIGTTFGGDGINTFALPDLRGRAVVGAGTGPGLQSVALGQVIGSPEVTLTQGQMPFHNHDLPTGGVSDFAGGFQPFSTQQPGLGLNYIIALQASFPPMDGPGAVPGDIAYLGEVIAFAGNFAPKGWALANGQLLSISQNQALFAVLGTQFGGDGRTTFALPDLRGRSIMGAGQGFTVGTQLGQQYTTLSVNNLPAHTHNYSIDGAVPEPASWAMMIGGFALVGGLMRRRVKRAVVFS